MKNNLIAVKLGFIVLIFLHSTDLVYKIKEFVHIVFKEETQCLLLIIFLMKYFK